MMKFDMPGRDAVFCLPAQNREYARFFSTPFSTHVSGATASPRR